MKTLLIALFICIASFASAQDWATVDYKYSNGPVSPEYQKSYNITVDNDRNVVMTYTTNTNAPKSDTYSRRLTKSQFKTFVKKLNATGFLTDGFNPNFMDKMKVGGPAKSININWTGKRAPVVLNENLGDSGDLKNFESLCMTIEKLIPNKIWKNIK